MKTVAELQSVLDASVNDLIAAHGGRIEVVRRDANFVSVMMQGGCHGCAGARYTLRMVVGETLKQADPTVTDIVDVTDHASGQNPYYKE